MILESTGIGMNYDKTVYSSDVHPKQLQLVVNVGNQCINLNVEEVLGVGAFGTVTRAVDNRGVSFAVKNVICRDNDTYWSIAQEIVILLKLKHPNIVCIYGVDFINSTVLMIMEFCSQGTLNKRLDRSTDILVQLQWMQKSRSPKRR